MLKKFTLLLALLLAFGQSITAANQYGLPDKIQDGNILHCFDWTFDDIKAMLPQIAEAGFVAVQVSPIQGNCNKNAEWYFAYMPYDFTIKGNGNGSRATLTQLCSEAAKYGIKIVVDVVANHVNQAKGYHDTWWDSNGRVRWNGGCDYGNRYSITHGQLGDYGDVNSEDAEVQKRAKTFIEDLKSCGVAGIRWDAAKHIGLPSEGCNFWSTVCSVAGLWHYGEILDGPGGDANKLMQEYTKYMSVTDNGYSNNVRGAICNGQVPGNSAGWAANTISADKVVYWGESHDDYSNEWKASTNITQDKIDRTWAIGACRAGAVGLYFSRPSATDRNAIKMGQKGSTHFTSKEIAAINHLRNAAVGTKEYYTAENGIACITREGVGAAIIIGAGGSRQVTVKNGGGFVPAGTYTDEVSGNKFTVTAATISGQVGNTGIAVISGKAVKYPSVTLNPDGGTFRSETLKITATASNATSAWYKIGNGAQTAINGTATFTIGANMKYDESVTVTWGATGAEGSKTGSATYTKKDPNASIYVYYNNPKNWSQVYCYIYSQTAGEVAEWPGSIMSKDNKVNLWCMEVPEAFMEGGMVIFSNGNGDQYPGANQPGLALNGKSMICRDNSTWKEYDGSSDPGSNPGTNPGTPSGQSGTYCYLENNRGWNAPTVWAWDANNGNTNCTSANNWPGEVMKSEGNYWIWKAAAGKTPTHIIFSNSGNEQTDNLEFKNGAIYNCEGQIVGQTNPGTSNPGGNPGTPSADPTKAFNVFFDNSSANWATPKVHYWGGDSASEWPGTDMQPYKGSVWVYKVAANTTGLVFNNGSGDKTDDFDAIPNHLYSRDGDQGVYSDAPSAVGFVTVTDVPAEYFDLTGKRVINPSRGIYIVRRGGSVTKELVK